MGGAMRTDAFDDMECPFNFKKELRKARTALNAKVGKYISKNRMRSYRELAKEFHLSLGTLSKIARRYEPKRKPGPRPRQNKQLTAPEGETAPVVSIENTDTE
jgi:transposase